MKSSSGRDLRTLPKAHLHVHLEGGMRSSTLAELAVRDGQTTPAFVAGGPFAEFEAAYRAASQLVRSADDVRRLVLELAEDAAESGAVWLEPALYVSSGRAEQLGLGSDAEYLELLLDAAKSASGATGVGIGLIPSANRGRAPEEAEQMASLAAAYAGRGVVGFGLVGDETAGRNEAFAGAFAIARSAGLMSVPHAGELLGAESVGYALDGLMAHRIQHGVRAFEEPALVERLAKDRVCLDVCPTSNLMLSVVPMISAHPLPALLAAGVPISINADDPLFFGASLVDEYALSRDAFGLEDATLAAIARCSIESSGAPAFIKREAVGAIDAWLQGS